MRVGISAHEREHRRNVLHGSLRLCLVLLLVKQILERHFVAAVRISWVVDVVGTLYLKGNELPEDKELDVEISKAS